MVSTVAGCCFRVLRFLKMARVFLDLPRVSTTALNPGVPQKLGYPFSHLRYVTSTKIPVTSLSHL
ncbi:hypothetical protein Hanom_Chr12g01090441 [Helianthus anomalus]